MFDTSTVTIAGNVVADPRISGLPDNPERVTFRVVANRRRKDPATDTWVDAGEFGINVVCWRSLARGVAQSVRRGDPVLVMGRIGERSYEVDGVRRWITEVTADFIGHDLAKGYCQYYRFSRMLRSSAEPPAGSPSSGQEPAAEVSAESASLAGDGGAAEDVFGGDDSADLPDFEDEEAEPELSPV